MPVLERAGQIRVVVDAVARARAGTGSLLLVAAGMTNVAVARQRGLLPD